MSKYDKSEEVATPSLTGMYGIIGYARYNFKYGTSVSLTLGKGFVSGDGVPNIRNLANEDLSEIHVSRFHHKNEVTLTVPKYLGSDMKDYKGFAGTAFLIASLSENFDSKNLHIIARL